MNKLIYTLLFTIVNIVIYSCPNSSSNKNNNSSGKDNNNCKYEIYFDKEFLNDKNLVVKNKEIEDCYVAVKNGAEHKFGRTPDLGKAANFFNVNFCDNSLMRVYEVADKLKFIKVTKDNIEENAIYFLGAIEYNLNFVIFKDIKKAIEVNKQYKLATYSILEESIKNLLS